MATLDIGEPTQILGGADPPTLLRNQDTALTIEICDTKDGLGLGADAGGSSATPLGPGSAIQWPAGLTCYAHTIVAPPATAVLVLVPNATGLLPTSLEIAEQISALGIPIIDRPLSLSSGAIPSGGSFPVNQADVAAYASLDLSAGVANLGTATSIDAVVTWYDATGTIILAVDVVGWTGSGQIPAFIGSASLDVKGPVVTINVISNGTGAEFSCLASYRTLDRERYMNQGDGTAGTPTWQDGSGWLFASNVNAGAQILTQVPSRNGRAQLVAGAPASFQIYVYDAITGTEIAALLLPAVTSQRVTVPFTAPKTALGISITNEDAANHTPTIGLSFAD